MTNHERPGVYSSYDASSVVFSGTGAKTVGLAARAGKGETDKAVTLTSYAAGINAFGEDGENQEMGKLLRLLFANGAAKVVAVRVADGGALSDYTSAFAVLGAWEDAQVLACDSADAAIHQALRDAATAASGCRKERIAVVGGADETAAELVAHAAELNSERVVLVGPDGRSGGAAAAGIYCAAAMAGAVAANRDPAAPMNGAELSGLESLSAEYGDTDVDLLVRGGVTPLGAMAGIISPVRCVTTRTTTGGAADATWRELTTILIVDEVIPGIRNALHSKFVRTKNTAQTRGAIRSQVIVELERRAAAEMIDGYGEVTVTAAEDDPTVCLVEFSFAVAHGLNKIYLTAHITV